MSPTALIVIEGPAGAGGNGVAPGGGAATGGVVALATAALVFVLAASCVAVTRTVATLDAVGVESDAPLSPPHVHPKTTSNTMNNAAGPRHPRKRLCASVPL